MPTTIGIRKFHFCNFFRSLYGDQIQPTETDIGRRLVEFQAQQLSRVDFISLYTFHEREIDNLALMVGGKAGNEQY